jgi:hypothetical protein
MRIVETIDVVRAGSFPRTRGWRRACRDVAGAVRRTDWPHGSGRFTIRPIVDGNGVTPIKLPCIRRLEERGWQTESFPNVGGDILKTGDLDALLETSSGEIGFEWETGNISSSHRAINKLLLALHRGMIAGGILVVPSAALYRFLTQRVGNIRELRPYLDLWRAIPVRSGAFRIVVVQHDEESETVRLIPKSTAGRARR